MEKLKNKSTVFFIAAVFLPYLLYGFTYYPILDDFIQYGCYPAYKDLSHVYLTIGTLSTRPLAGLLDPAFWGLFWRTPGIALCLITALHLLTGLLLRRTLQNLSLETSPFFLLLFFLFPLGMEGRYWLSAATRIIPGLFFSALSLYFLSLYIMRKKDLLSLALFALFQLLSCGFYESVAVFSASLACLFFLTEPRRRNVPIPFISVINIGLIFTYYKLFADLGALGSRASSFSLADLPSNLGALFRQLFEMAGLIYPAAIIGFKEGVSLLLQAGFWGLFILLLIILVSLGIACVPKAKNPCSKKNSVFFLVGGLILFFAPLVPNLLTEDVWLTNRSLFVSCIGLFLMLEPLWAQFKGRLRTWLLFICAFICITATVNEYDVYRRVSTQDIRLINELVPQLDEAALNGEKPIQVILKTPVLTEQNALYKDHVKSVFDADWSLTGALRAQTGNLKPVCLLPKQATEDMETTDRFIVYLN